MIAVIACTRGMPVFLILLWNINPKNSAPDLSNGSAIRNAVNTDSACRLVDPPFEDEVFAGDPVPICGRVSVWEVKLRVAGLGVDVCSGALPVARTKFFQSAERLVLKYLE